MAAGFAPRSRSRPLRFRLFHSLFHSREPCRQVRERSRAPTQPPSSKRHSLPSSTFAPLFSLINRFSKCLFYRMYQVASTAKLFSQWRFHVFPSLLLCVLYCSSSTGEFQVEVDLVLCRKSRYGRSSTICKVVLQA